MVRFGLDMIEVTRNDPDSLIEGWQSDEFKAQGFEDWSLDRIEKEKLRAKKRPKPEKDTKEEKEAKAPKQSRKRQKKEVPEEKKYDAKAFSKTDKGKEPKKEASVKE